MPTDNRRYCFGENPGHATVHSYGDGPFPSGVLTNGYRWFSVPSALPVFAVSDVIPVPLPDLIVICQSCIVRRTPLTPHVWGFAMSSGINRRDFVVDSTKLALGAMIVPRHVLGATPHRRAPSDTLNFAIVGFGGMGMNNTQELVDAGENLVAICDIDMAYVERQLAGKLRPNREGVVSPSAIKLKDAYTKAAKYADFREMLDKQKDIEAVIIATPDHLHATVAVAAMKAGKHVYVQKPLTYSVYEARLLSRVAAETKVATQMGNQ